MTTTHTPGPWKIGTGWIYSGSLERNGDMVTRDRRVKVCEITGYPYGDSEANARLIAAAPELLAALKDLTESDTVDRHDYERAAAAIAKAEGK